MSIDREEFAMHRISEMIYEYAEDIALLWRWGDGNGGYIISKLTERFGNDLEVAQSTYKKKNISGSLKKKVFERDMYRCVYCGDHIDLCADHIHPESKGGETSLENLQTLCRSCNSKKGSR